MSNLALVAELMDHWLREENQILTHRVRLLENSVLSYRVANTLLTERATQLSTNLEDQQDITNIHVDLNFRLQERIDYLELLLLRSNSDMELETSDTEPE